MLVYQLQLPLTKTVIQNKLNLIRWGRSPVTSNHSRPLYSNHFLSSTVTAGQEFWSCSVGQFWLRVSYEVLVWCWLGLGSWGWRVTWLASWDWPVGFSPHGPLHRVTCLSWHGSWLCPEQAILKTKTETQGAAIHRCEYQEVRILGYLRVWLPFLKRISLLIIALIF